MQIGANITRVIPSPVMKQVFHLIQDNNDLHWLGNLLARSINWNGRKSFLPNPGHFQFFGDSWKISTSSPYHMILCLQTAVNFRGGIPVVILLEGEGFVSGLVSRFPGQDLAAEGVIVVSVSYRLNVFGKWRITGQVVCIQVIRISESELSWKFKPSWMLLRASQQRAAQRSNMLRWP